MEEPSEARFSRTALRELDRARSAAGTAEERAQDAERRAESATVSAVRARDALATAAREIPVPEDADGAGTTTRTLPSLPPVQPLAPLPRQRAMATSSPPPGPCGPPGWSQARVSWAASSCC